MHNPLRGSMPSSAVAIGQKELTFMGGGQPYTVPVPAPAPSNEVLAKVFEAYTNKRLARTSALVRAARTQGEIRVVQGVDACTARNNKVRTMWQDQGTMSQGYMAVWKGLFEEENPAESERLARMSFNE